MVVPRPDNDVHSNMQIAWMNEVMHKENIILNHALNGHRLVAFEMFVLIQSHFKDRQQLKTLKVDSFTGLLEQSTSFKDVISMVVCSEPEQFNPK